MKKEGEENELLGRYRDRETEEDTLISGFRY